MDINDCILLSKLLDCIPFQCSDEEDNFKNYLIQLKLVEVAFHKALSHNISLSQANPIKVNEHRIGLLEPFLREQPRKENIWKYHHEQVFSQCDFSYYLEDSKDLLPFYSLAMSCAMSFASISELDDEDIDIYMRENVDWYLEFLSEEEFELAIAISQEMRAEVILTEKRGYSEHPLIKKLISELNRSYFHGIVSDQAICHNLSLYIQAFMTYGYYDIDIYTIGNSLLARYMQIKNTIPTSELKDAVERAASRFFEPIPVGMYGIEPIVALSDKWVAVTYVLGGLDSESMISENNMFPFFTLALNILDTLLPVILEGKI